MNLYSFYSKKNFDFKMGLPSSWPTFQLASGNRVESSRPDSLCWCKKMKETLKYQSLRARRIQEPDWGHYNERIQLRAYDREDLVKIAYFAAYFDKLDPVFHQSTSWDGAGSRMGETWQHIRYVRSSLERHAKTSSVQTPLESLLIIVIKLLLIRF